MKLAEHLTTADGFLDLGMVDEAWAELDEIEPLERANPSVIAMRLRILQRMARFEAGVEIARGAVRAHPNDLDLWLLGSRHIRAAEGIDEALEFLLGSGERFTSKAACWFELACLHCQAGDLERAADCTRRAVDLDRSYQMRVLDDPDLEPLRASW
jgi:tetratricopeptide (TPR) repeat protein